MRRGTTPTLELALDQSLEGAEYHVTIEQGTAQLDKTEADCTLSEDGRVIAVVLSQEETLALEPNAVASIQVRYKLDGRAYATNIVAVRVDDVLLEEVI